MSLDLDLDKKSILENLNSTPEGLILFGSYARNDQDRESDVDILVLNKVSAPSFQVGKFNYSVYTKSQLFKMAESGSLFILHVITEGIEIFGNKNIINNLRLNFKKPLNYAVFREKIKDTANLLDVDKETYSTRYLQLNRLLSFLFRSFVYSKFVDKGEITFSMKEISEKLKDDRFSVLEKLKNLKKPDYSIFNYCKKTLEEYFECEIINEYGSAEALILIFYPENKLGITMGLRLLNEEGKLIDYEMILKKSNG